MIQHPGETAAGLEQHIILSPTPTGRPDETERSLTSCPPTINIPSSCCFKRLSVPHCPNSKTMASWIGISTSAPTRPLFLIKCIWRYSRQSSAVLNDVINQDSVQGIVEAETCGHIHTKAISAKNQYAD